MDKPKFATMGIVLGLVGTFLGMWPALSKMLGELPGLVQTLTGGQLFGIGSFFIAWLFGFCIWWALWHYEAVCRGRPHLCSDVWSVVVGWLAYMVQQVLAAGTPKQMAYAFLIMGPLAGLLAFLASRVVWAVWAPPKEPKP
jgi:hypothetical protein